MSIDPANHNARRLATEARVAVAGVVKKQGNYHDCKGDNEETMMGKNRFAWNNLSLRAKSLLILALAVLPLALALASVAFNAAMLRGTNNQLRLDRENRLSQAELLSAMIDAETGVRGFLLTQQEPYLQPYRSAVETVPTLLAAIEKHEGEIANDETDELRRLIDKELNLLQGLIDDESSAPELAEAKETMDELRSVTASLEEKENQQIADLLDEREGFQRQQTVLFGLAVLLSLLGAGGAGLLFLRGLVSRIQAATENARLMAEGEPLEPTTAGTDELGQLQRRIEQTANLLRAQESNLRQAKEEAENANRAKSEFLSRMSHELRTPLNAILGFGQLLQMEDLNKDQHDAVNHVVRGGRHLLDLINEVLDISRIETGQLSLSREPVDIFAVVEESLALVRPLTTANNITVDLDLPSDMARFALADRQRLKQILLNLLSNAIKYNRANGSVTVKGRSRAERMLIEVSDTGLGLSPGDMEALFTPFDRLGAERSGIEGTGLGLSLSKGLAEAMGGNIFVTSELGRGSTFIVELPSADDPGHKEVPDSVPSILEKDGIERLKILYIEDNEPNLTLVESIFRQQQRHVDLLSSTEGLRGIDIARQDPVDLILLDVNLPDISGAEVLRMLKSDPRTASVPVVMLSADATAGQIERFRSSGAVDYLTKPIDVAQFLQVVNRSIPDVAS